VKLILAVVPESDATSLVEALVGSGFRVTRAASSGGFLRKGSSTLLVGLEEEKVEGALAVFRSAFPETDPRHPPKAHVFVIKNSSLVQI
jgi:uncharacterized protein YaaQ